ncbi:PfkB family carbohydrate kinase [Candidatus Latescibacterota bacterium]
MGKSIVSIGEMLGQFFIRPGASKQNIGFGGDSLAVAATISHISDKYGLGIAPQYYTAVGPEGDSGSDDALDYMAGQGVGIDLVQRIPDRTVGTFVINYNENNEMIPDPDTGERYIFDRLKSAATQMLSSEIDERVMQSLSNDFDYVYLSQISIAVLCHRPGTRGAGADDQNRLIDIFAEARRNGKTTALSTNLRSGLWEFSKGDELTHPQKREALRILDRMLGHSDIVLSSIADEQELEFYDEDTPQYRHAARMHDFGVKKIAMTDGPRDIFVSWYENGVLNQEWVKPFPVKKEDEANDAGTGDAFAGGFVLGDMIGKSPVVSAGIGALMGSTALKCTGAIIDRESIPGIDELL